MHGRSRKLAEMAAPIKELLKAGTEINDAYELIPALVEATGSPADARRSLLAAIALLDIDIRREMLR